MKEKIKLILENTQMRNLIYLLVGFIVIIILILIYNPNLEYRVLPSIVDEENVKIPYDNYKNILENYSKLDTYFYKIKYKDYYVNGYSIAGTFNDSIDIDEIKEIEKIIKPSNIYEMIKDKKYVKDDNQYIYNLDKKIVIVINEDEVIKLIYDDFIIEYGG